MLVNSFDTKYAQTASKYEYLDNAFTKILSSNKKFSRIFTSVIEDKSLKSLSEATLRSDITGQVINTILTHDSTSKHYLYYMGDVFKKIILVIILSNLDNMVLKSSICLKISPLKKC